MVNVLSSWAAKIAYILKKSYYSDKWGSIANDIKKAVLQNGIMLVFLVKTLISQQKGFWETILRHTLICH